jgi:hypothetical protein
MRFSPDCPGVAPGGFLLRISVFRGRGRARAWRLLGSAASRGQTIGVQPCRGQQGLFMNRAMIAQDLGFTRFFAIEGIAGTIAE